MLIDMKCSNCGAHMQFDNTREFMFCEYCGHRVANVNEQVNINQQVNVSGTVYHVQDRSNEPNLYISYNTSNPKVGMVTRIVSTGVKSTYVNGQTLSFHLNQGRQLIVLKIGSRNYNREVVIPPDNSPVRIYASFNGRARISIDQPRVAVGPAGAPPGTQYVQQFSNSNPQGTVTAVQQPVAASYPAVGGARKSGLSILAFILSFTLYLSWAGVGVAVLDAFFMDKEKQQSHGLSYAAMSIGGFMTLCLIIILASK